MTVTFDHGGTIFATARSMGIAPEELLDFSASINPLGMAPGVKAAVLASFDRLLHYPDSEATELGAALAELHCVAPEQVCIANGSTELIYLLPRLVGGTRGLIIAPPFSEYAKALAASGYEVDYLDLLAVDDFALPLAKLEEQLGKGYDLLYICNPGNPSGRLYPRSEIEAVIELCAAAGTFLVLDEAFMDFCEEESAKHLVAASGNGVALRSMTKFYAIPGLRLGFALGSIQVISRLRQLREPWSVNTVAQVAAHASLADTDYRERTLASVRKEREFLSAELAALPGLQPFTSAANYILVKIISGITAGELQERLLRERILIRNCDSFRGLSDRYFRIAVRTRLENERLIAALSGGSALTRG